MKIKAMTYEQNDKYLDFVESLQVKIVNGDITNGKAVREASKYMAEMVYGINTKETKLTPATITRLCQLTMAETEKINDDDIKNFKSSGTGELEEDQSSATIAEEQKSNKAEK